MSLASSHSLNLGNLHDERRNFNYFKLSTNHLNKESWSARQLCYNLLDVPMQQKLILNGRS